MKTRKHSFKFSATATAHCRHPRNHEDTCDHRTLRVDNVFRTQSHTLSSRVDAMLATMATRKTKMLDPTRTITIRKAFVREVDVRFAKLKREIREAIIKDDIFGLKPRPTIQVSPGKAAFAFETNAAKVDSFMGWLEKQQDLNILGVDRAVARGVVGNVAWADVYIDSSYQRGMRRANAEMLKAGINTNRIGDGWVQAAFNGPIHADRVGLIYTRVFQDLKGVTAAMDAQISRTLAQGLIDGLNPREMARQINDRVDKIGITRARTIARTEVIRAHHVGNINTYREAKILEIKVQAEWRATGDDRTCPECEYLNGQTFTLDAIEGMIPLHPNCRCVALPVAPKLNGVKRNGENVRREARKAVRKNKGLPNPRKQRLKKKAVKANKPLPLAPLPTTTPAKTVARKRRSDIRSGDIKGRARGIPVMPERYEVLSSGGVTDTKILGGGVNNAALITFKKGSGNGAKGVVKFQEGEYWPSGMGDGSKFTAAQREKAAYQLSQEVGFGNVPYTTYRDVKLKTTKQPKSTKASVQEFIPNANTALDIQDNWRDVVKLDDLHESTVFDALAGSYDRHGGNFLIDGNSKLHLIDNGYSFAPDIAVNPNNAAILRAGTGSLEKNRVSASTLSKIKTGLEELDVEKFAKTLGWSDADDVAMAALEGRRRVLLSTIIEEAEDPSGMYLVDAINYITKGHYPQTSGLAIDAINEAEDLVALAKLRSPYWR